MIHAFYFYDPPEPILGRPCNKIDPDFRTCYLVGHPEIEFYFCLFSFVCLCLTSNQQQRSYGDGPQLKVSSDGLVKPGFEPVTPGLQSELFVHYTTAASVF